MPYMTTILAVAVLTNLTDISSAIHTSRIGERFALDGTVLISGQSSNTLFMLACQEQCMTFRDVTADRQSTKLSAGNTVRATGAIAINENGLPAPNCDEIYILDTTIAKPPPDVSAHDLQTGRFNNKLVQIRGTVRRTFRDEIDPKYIRLSLSSDGLTFQVTCCDDKAIADNMRSLIGAEVLVTGVYSHSISGFRELFGKAVNTLSPAAIRVLRPAPQDPFSAPQIDTATPASPDEVAALGRLRTAGRVIAVRQGRELLMRDTSGKVRKVTFESSLAPACGDKIEVVGNPETDLYRINLTDAIWRKFDGPLPEEGPVIGMTVSELLTDGYGNYKINPTLHGRAVRIEGTVVNLPGGDPAYGIMTLKSGDFVIPVDISTNFGIAEDLDIGCRIAVSGTCIVETEAWRPHSALPRTTGITIVVRTPRDVVILSRPSWWTPQRLMIVVGVLLLAVLVIFIWNRLLQRVIDRKSRQLLREKVAHIKAALRIDERTHLAVELHDSLSQNLSGVACQIAATKGTLPAGADETARHLSTAERMLLSCRTELRRCLWDLRENALEERDFAEAIRKTVEPVSVGAEVEVNFDVPRTRLNDTTAHAILCIVRELVANAIRHGKARKVLVAGCLRDNDIVFSVTDDGIGFNPSTAPGAAEGHFGIEGVRERVNRFDGKMSISSTIGKGTEVSIEIKLATDN